MNTRVAHGVLLLAEREMAYRRHQELVYDDTVSVGKEIQSRDEWLKAFEAAGEWCESVEVPEEMKAREIVEEIFNGQ